MSDRATAPGMVKVWDPFVRGFHWLLLTLIAVCWLTEDGPKTLHQASGYGVAALIVMRILWGFVGPRHARFSDFVRGPRKVLAYLAALLAGREPRFLGHNPAGGAMIVALILAVGATALTGWLQTTDAFWGAEWLEEVHEMAATMILVLAAVHVAGVIVESWRHRENLVTAMIDGHKRGH
ncbi:cytochrome b/b6 domain-containing protein [Gemmobacter caeruleus]|uniref:cytochrome b/b6 domain-containing protein n=1 Tax=Gemmobacter caeruleus TaxID=2595004 RepID=UPI001EF05457|nr:cytochrome b/b6 domain-containing protein [Gemmobacter caeruleus]